jgi:hypothetical protein
VLLRMERWKEAKSRLEPLLDDSSNRARDLGSMGVIAAGLREPAEAREWMTRLEPSRFQGLQRAEALLSQARIAAALGMDESALKFLRTASTNGLASGQGTHDPIFEKLRTHEQFVTWATPRELLDSR